MNMPKKLFIIIAFAGIITGYLLKYNFLRYKLYFYNPQAIKEENYPNLSPGQALMLGGAHTQEKHPKTSYIKYPLAKKPGNVRIGIFGCSIVAGDETAPGYDIASLLNDKFIKNGFKNIEVINFGLTARGVHQMYLLWQFIGKDYGLDYVVFFPFSWHKYRDNSFTWSALCYPPVYARYILKDNDIQLIQPAGKNLKETYTGYYRLLPPFRYIRYDAKIPMFLRVLLPRALHIRTNPLYYKFNLKKSDKEEILKTYEIIFEKIASQSKNLIIVANDDEICGFKKALYAPNAYFLKSQIPGIINSFLYLGPLGHNSAIGNQLRADELFYLFTGPQKAKLNIIELSFEIGQQNINNPAGYPATLDDYDSVSLNIGPYAVASFIKFIPLVPIGIEATNWDFRREKTKSLLFIPEEIFPAKDLSPALMLNSYKELSRFLPLSFALRDNEQVYLASFENGKKTKVAIGAIHSPYGVIGEIKINKSIHFTICKQDYALEIGNSEIPLKDFIYARAKAGHFVDIELLSEDKGNVDLVLTKSEGHQKRYPIFHYILKPTNTSLPASIYPQPILRKSE